jgi:hypothetical protein
MNIGQIAKTYNVNVNENVRKTAEHVQLAEDNKALIKENSTDFLFEMGAVKVQVHKENRTEFQKKSLNKDTESFTNDKKAMMTEMSEESSKLADISVAKKRVDSLFKPTKRESRINFIA